MSDNSKRKLNYPRIIGWALGVLIILAIALIIIKIKIWDKGVALDTEIDDNPEFDFETVDSISALPVSMVRDDDDGVLTIVMLGNDTYAENSEGYNLISETIAEGLNATVYNLCLDESAMVTYTENLAYDLSPKDAYSLYGVVTAITSGDYSPLRNGISYVSEGLQADYLRTIDKMESIDYNNVDLLFICYDAHDYEQIRPHYDSGNPKNPMSMTGAVDSSLDLLYEAYPSMQIAYVTPAYCKVYDNGEYIGADIANYGHGNLPTVNEPILSFALANTKTSYVDLFVGSGITEETFEEDFDVHFIIPNDNGKRKIANRIVKLFKYMSESDLDSEE